MLVFVSACVNVAHMTIHHSQIKFDWLVFARYVCRCQKKAFLRMVSFSYNRITNNVSTGFSGTRQSDLVKVDMTSSILLDAFSIYHQARKSLKTSISVKSPGTI